MNSPGAADSLGLQWLQRDWLSANHIVFKGGGGVPAAVVDTGYARHAELTMALLDHALGGQALELIVNTHLHSDHCGGNRALQARWSGVQTWVPAPSFERVAQWDEERLSYRATGQHCERFRVDGVLQPGQTLALGPAAWQVLPAGGHDPDAVMLFEPQTRTLISGDALWEDRLAIIFPEIAGEPGFAAARETLDRIEALAPRWVIPGHGAAFGDVAAALAASRSRLAAFERAPDKHVRHAARALVMFHMMEVQTLEPDALQAWLLATPIFQRMAALLAGAAGAAAWGSELLAGLQGDGLLVAHEGVLRLPATPPG